MNANRHLHFATCLVLALMPSITIEAAANTPAAKPASALPSGAKGMFLRQLNNPAPVNIGLQYSIELNRNGQISTVGSQFAFKSGDQIRFRVRPNIKGYMYIVLKSEDGTPNVLFPMGGANESNNVYAGQELIIPSEGPLEFDNNPGTERVQLLLSRNPIQSAEMKGLQRKITINPKGQQNTIATNCFVDAPTALTLNEQITLVSNEPDAPLAVDLALRHDPAGPVTLALASQDRSSTAPPKVTAPPVEAVRPKTTIQTESSTAMVTLPQPGKDTAIKDKWALVIGVSKFKKPGMNLLFASKDASDFATFLVKEANFAADHVKLLTNDQATRERILIEAADNGGWLSRNVKPNDLVVVYIASHATDDGGNHATNYLVAHDTDPERAFTTGINLKELANDIRKQLKTRVLMVMDTCHSGAMKSVSIMPKANLDDVFQGTGHLVLASCQPTQVSFDSVKFNNGLFTKCLIDGLRQYKTLDQAFKYTQHSVMSESKAQFKQEQTPVLKTGEWQGKLVVLSAPPTEPRALVNP